MRRKIFQVDSRTWIYASLQRVIRNSMSSSVLFKGFGLLVEAQDNIHVVFDKNYKGRDVFHQ